DGTSPSEGSRQPVLSMALSMHDQPVGGEERSWLLRGIALDQYEPQSRTWVRNATITGRDLQLDVPAGGLHLAQLPDNQPVITARITLRDAPQQTLFTLHPVTYVSGVGLSTIAFNPED